MKKVLLKELKKGDFFTLKPYEEPEDRKVYVKSDYDRSSKKYCCYKFSDINSETLKKGTTAVYTDFIF